MKAGAKGKLEGIREGERAAETRMLEKLLARRYTRGQILDLGYTEEAYEQAKARLSGES